MVSVNLREIDANLLDTCDIDKICRLCLGSGNLRNLIDSPLLDNFRKISKIQIDLDNELPKKVCDDCLIRLAQFNQLTSYVFHCKRAQDLLDDYFYTKDHKTEVFQSDRSYKCEMCEVKVANIREHRRSNKDCRFKCTLCDFTALTRFLLKQHAASHSTNKPHACKLCKARFIYANNLSRHMRVHKKGKEFECFKCGKKYTTKIHLEAHLNAHSGLKPYSCDFCTKSFIGRVQRSVHMKKHHYLHSKDQQITNDANKCHICNLLFTERAEFVQHLEQFHPDSANPEVTLCTVCGKKFNSRCQYRNHMLDHEGRRFSCTECPFTTKVRQSLYQHKKIHTGERKFECEHCGKRFKQKSHLNIHVQRHGDKKYECKTCGKLFHVKWNMYEHEKGHTKKHTPYVCSVCYQTFATNDGRKKHIRSKHAFGKTKNNKDA